MCLEKLEGGPLDKSSNPRTKLVQEHYTEASAKSTALRQMGRRNRLSQSLKTLAAVGSNFWCLSSRRTSKGNLGTKDWRQARGIDGRLQRRRCGLCDIYWDVREAFVQFDDRDSNIPVVGLVNGVVNVERVDDDDVSQTQRDANMLQKQKHIAHLSILGLRPVVIPSLCPFRARQPCDRDLCRHICKGI